MKTRTVTIIALIYSIILSSCGNDDNSINTPKTLKDDIENQEFVTIIEDHLSGVPKNVQVAIAIINNESTEYLGVYNNNNVLRGIDNADKIFEIGSITKVFTGICLSKLAGLNKVTFDETLQNQFDFPLKEGGDITLLHLATHTSGLPRLPNNSDEVEGLDLNDPYALYNQDHLHSYLQNHIVLNSEIGTAHEYSNIGMGMLGYILANKIDTSYEELLQNQIFEPLQMSNSTTLLANVDKTKLITGLDKEGNPVQNWNFTDIMAGTGSIKSSVIDLEKFAQKNFEDDIVYNFPQSTLVDLDQDQGIGLGWYILEKNGNRLLNHSGETGGYSSLLVIDKNHKKAVIVLSNIEDSKTMNELGFSFLENITTNK